MRRILRSATVALVALSVGGLTTVSPAFSAAFAASPSVGASSSKAPSQDQLYTVHYENVLGTSFDMKVVSASEAEADKAEAAALAEIDREAKILSSWDPNSEFSRWFRTQDQPVRVSLELFEVLGLFDKWRGLTSGALDASAEAITRVWQAAAAEKRLPTQPEINAAVAGVQMTHWKLDREANTATHTSETPLAMNSFVKSYIIGHSADAALRVAGVRGVVVNIGGDLVVRGDLSESVDIADPKSDAENGVPIARLAIRDRAVATSGDYRRGVEIGGVHYSHIVDPRTGMPADRIISSTVVAPIAADAGALATAFSVLTPEESQKLAAKIPGVEYLLVRNDGEIVTSEGWAALETPRAPRSAKSASAPVFETVAANNIATEWDPNYELTIGISINLIQGFRVTRPYVAVWIEDADGRPVRTIALWFNKFRYLHELQTWYSDQLLYRTDGAQTLASSISSATRPPGTYTLNWDGKDQAGNSVKPGKYRVFVEVSREHGTRQLMRQDMDFNGTPKRVNLPGGIEIASAYFDYHKISH
jgi:thiamine biosynthesis lipoprotein ApbE